MSTLPRQSGYILLTVVVMLAALMVLATQFLSRSGQSVQMSGYDRDAAEAAQLTESAMNFVYGQFTYGGDLNSDTIADNLTSFDPIKITTFTPPYLFYVSDLTSITSKTPSILQRIADGQSQDTKGTVNGARVPTLSAKLKVEDSDLKLILFDVNNWQFYSHRCIIKEHLIYCKFGYLSILQLEPESKIRWVRGY